MASSGKYKGIEELDENGVQCLLEKWNLEEFSEFAKEKHLDGKKLLDISEGIIKLWKPKANAMILVNFIKDIKQHPHKYVNSKNNDDEFDIIEITDNNKTDIESQYQTIPIRKKEANITMSTVEDIIKRIKPAKSFLYRHQQRVERTPSYLPMDAGTPKKRKIFSLSSYEYPFLDLKARFSKQENPDKGYYCMKRNSRYYFQRTYKKVENKTKYMSLPVTEENIEKIPEDHFYEDLCYNEVEEKIEKDKIEKEKPTTTTEAKILNVKPCMVKIQEIFQSIRVPFFRKHETLEEKKVESEKDGNFYENGDSIANMYDSVHVNKQANEVTKENKSKLAVEDYLEPVQVEKDYCDVSYKQKDDSILGYILSIFENRFGIKRETNDDQPEDCPDVLPSEEVKADGGKPRTNMADRPLPVPVENEPFYMNIDRNEAQNLLKGHPDGTFILRPSSQPDHAYTLSVACTDAVHNIGVRRRPDGRLSLGYARRGEQSFVSVTSLLRHHKKRRLLLVAGGEVIGATTLNESPQYYQTPTSIPIQNP